MTAKEALHQRIDHLSDDQADLLLRALDGDPVARSLALAPIDDEPLSPEEVAAADEGRADLERGNVVSHDEIRRQLGM
jgi:hypothetical protein